MRDCPLSQFIVFVGCAYLHTHKQPVGLHIYLQYLTLCTVYSICMASISLDLHYYGFTLVISYASEWTVEVLKCMFCF